MTRDIRKTLHVPLTPEDAFRVFTADIALWWPVDSHSLSASRKARPKRLDLDPFAGGTLRETLPDGSVEAWATITDWTPGARLSMDWYVGRTPDEATQISVTFLPEDSGTRVDLVHGGFERFVGDAGNLSDQYRSGWDMVFGTSYVGACLARAA